MFERFTERAQHAIGLAQDEARALRHNYVGSEHILLGLLGEESGLASYALHAKGVTLQGARAAVVRFVGEGVDEVPQRLPFTPWAKKALELSLREALSLGHSYIGTEHLLLGLLSSTGVQQPAEGVAHEPGSLAGRVLAVLGADPDELRELTIAQLSRPVQGTARRAGLKAASGPATAPQPSAEERWLELGERFVAAVEGIERHLGRLTQRS